MRHRIAAGGLAAIAALALIACNNAAAPAGTASQAASTVPSSEPSASPSEALASASSSLAIPSFQLPSGDKELEALLPDTICGETAVKLSMTGPMFQAGADPEFQAVLQALGRSPEDVSFAIAGSSGCAAGVFRVKGTDANAFRTTFLSEMQKEGTSFTERSVGGKTVMVATEGTDLQYAYFVGDAVFFVNAPDDAKAAEIIAALP